jgi:signal transduction histidine kinase
MADYEFDTLVVEDDEVFRRELRRRLDKIARFDVAVTMCETLDEARAALDEQSFDIGLFDYSLPDGSSLDLVEYLASDLQNPIALIIVTSLDDEETRNEIIAAGAQDYLVKGNYDNSLLERSILLAVERRRGSHLRRRLAKTSRLVELGSLAADVAHHFNNPLAILSNNLQFEEAVADRLESLVDKGELYTDEVAEIVAELREIRDESAQALSRLTRLISDIQLLDGPTTDAVEPCDVNELLREAVRHADTDDVEVEIALVDVPMISVDQKRMVTAFTYALDNAAEAAVKGGGDSIVEIVTDVREQGVRVEISDSGPGVPAELREDVFRPFYTTKPPSEGRGMGLPVIFNVVRAHGGKVEMKSTAQGTALSIWLPKDAGGLGDTPLESLYGDTDVEVGASTGGDATEASDLP